MATSGVVPIPMADSSSQLADSLLLQTFFPLPFFLFLFLYICNSRALERTCSCFICTCVQIFILHKCLLLTASASASASTAGHEGGGSTVLPVVEVCSRRTRPTCWQLIECQFVCCLASSCQLPSECECGCYSFRMPVTRLHLH